MSVISQEYLDSIRDSLRVIEVEPRAVIQARLEADFAARLGVPFADLDPSLKMAFPLLAESKYVAVETVNQQWAAGTITFGVGEVLDMHGVERGVLRHIGETDGSYRLRLLNYSPHPYPITELAWQDWVLNYNPAIDDVQVKVRPNRQDVDIYALKAGDDLTTDERTAMLSAANARPAHWAGPTMFAPDVTKTAFTIAVAIAHPSILDSSVVAADARQRIYAFIDSLKIGDPVFRFQIEKAASFGTEDNPVASMPAADLPSVAGTIYTCGKDTTDVVITTSAY